MEAFTAAPHYAVLVLLVQVTVLLLAARGMGEVAQRLGQPSVVGEILAGILLGPSLLSGLVPSLGVWLVPAEPLQGYLLEVVSLLGAMLLLLITGLETDLALIRRHARTALGVSAGGILVTFTSGYVLGSMLPDSLLANPDDRTVFALFVATAMSISAIPVIAKVLMDMKLMRRDIGQTIIASGMSDDTVGWMLLSVVAGLATSGVVTAGTVGRAVGSVLVFMALSFTVGRWLVKRALDFVQDEVRSPDRLVTLVVVMTFAWGALTLALGLEAVLGAFVMGILFGQMPRLPEDVHHKLITASLAIFTPIFFAVAGLKVNVRSLLEPGLLLVTGLVILVASLGKVVGTYLGARIIGRRDHWTALSFGAGLNARGAMEIIIATIGLELEILSPEMFSIIVVMAMATSLMAPPALRWVLSRVQPEAQELERLRREEQAAGSVVSKIHRVLLPARPRDGKPIPPIQSFLLERMSGARQLSVTLLAVAPPGHRAEGAEFLDRSVGEFRGVDLTRKLHESDELDGLILDELTKDYDLLILGASQRASERDALFHPLVDRLVRLAPCPSLVVKGSSGDTQWPPAKILVPTNGSAASRNAADLAFLLAADAAEVVVINVIQGQVDSHALSQSERTRGREWRTARRIVTQLATRGDGAGVITRPEVRDGSDLETVVLDYARTSGVDLIVLGTDVRPGSDRLFLGPRVERILDQAPCPVIVFNGT